MSGNPCVIIEWSESDTWPSLFTHQPNGLNRDPVHIPEARRPTMLQPDRATAEAEAQRLAMKYPAKRFTIFEAAVLATTATIPSHITVKGEVWATRVVPVLLAIDDDTIPF